jgi:hypothetical protein
LWGAIAALLKAFGRWCSPGPVDGAVHLSFLQQHVGRWQKLAKGSDSSGHEGSQGLLFNFLFHRGPLCRLDGAASSLVSFAYAFVCVCVSVHFPYLVIYAARIVQKKKDRTATVFSTFSIPTLWFVQSNHHIFDQICIDIYNTKQTDYKIVS